jgi:transcriptional regulator GlxA family with amidase domain
MRTRSVLIVLFEDVQSDANLLEVPEPDILVVPGGVGTRSPAAELVAWLRQTAPRAGCVVSVCTGAFLLAEAVAGRAAGHHALGVVWIVGSALPERPGGPEPIFVRDGHFATSAGVTAGIDLALALVEDDLGRDVALSVARHLVMFLRRPGNQTQFSTQLAAQVARREPLRELQRWIAEYPDGDLSVPALAARACLCWLDALPATRRPSRSSSRSNTIRSRPTTLDRRARRRRRSSSGCAMRAGPSHRLIHRERADEFEVHSASG